MVAKLLWLLWLPGDGFGRLIPNGDLAGGGTRDRLMLLLDVQEQDFRLRGSLKFHNGSWSLLKVEENGLPWAEDTPEDFELK